MKAKRVITLFAVILLLMLFTFNVNGVSFNSEIVTESVSEEERNSLVSGTDISLLNSGIARKSIACFDVNERGLIAIGFDAQPRPEIHIYDNEGTFLYGYSFNCNGSFGIEFVGDNIAIYFVRGEYIHIYDHTGTNLDVRRVLNVAQNESWVSNIIDPTLKTVGGDHYRLERDIGLSTRSYSRLVKTDGQGHQTVIYDVSAEHNFRFAVISIFVIAFVTMFIIQFSKKLRNT